jgi:prepilin-type N-terminal cleavage/methylation domain-containing protein
MTMSHRKRSKQLQGGFSLIEILLVLFISCSLVSIVTFFSFKYIGEYNDTQIIYEIQTKIREAQFLGYANQKGHKVNYFKDNVFGIYRLRIDDWHFAQQIPPSVNLYFGANGSNYFFRIRSDMNFSGIGTLRVETSRGIEHYTMNIGKGRFTHVSSTE